MNIGLQASFYSDLKTTRNNVRNDSFSNSHLFIENAFGLVQCIPADILQDLDDGIPLIPGLASNSSITPTLTGDNSSNATQFSASSFLADLNKDSEELKRAHRTKTIPWGINTILIVQPKPTRPNAFAALLDVEMYEEEVQVFCKPVRGRRLNKYGFYEEIEYAASDVSGCHRRERFKHEALNEYIGAWLNGIPNETIDFQFEDDRNHSFEERVYAEYLRAKSKRALAHKSEGLTMGVKDVNSVGVAGWGRPWAVGLDVNVYIDCQPWGRPWAVE